MDILGFMLLAAFGILGLTPIIMAVQAQSIGAIILVAAAITMAATILLTTPTTFHEITAAILWLGGVVTAGRRWGRIVS